MKKLSLLLIVLFAVTSCSEVSKKGSLFKPLKESAHANGNCFDCGFFEITTKGSWSVKTDCDWFRVEQWTKDDRGICQVIEDIKSGYGDAELRVECFENYDTTERRGQFIITTEKGDYTIDVFQEGNKYPSFRLEDKELVFPLSGGTKKIRFSTFFEWKSNSSDWVTLSGAGTSCSGTNYVGIYQRMGCAPVLEELEIQTLEVNVEKSYYPRKGFVKIFAEGKTFEVKIVQK